MSTLIVMAEDIRDRAQAAGLMIATAESCTGGLVAGALTEVSGSSVIFDRGFVTYTDTAKQEMLGVSAQTLADFGAVSEETAREMARGAAAKSAAQLAVSTTGIAGPTGATPGKPVGLVWFGLNKPDGSVEAVHRHFSAMDRAQVRTASVETALKLLLSALP